MKMLRTAREGIQSLAANPLRTFFMMAGTIVGIAALTVIMAIGKGTESQVMKRVENFGPASDDAGRRRRPDHRAAGWERHHADPGRRPRRSAKRSPVWKS
jgi:ABC-type antimicrobial peptide transport system permease subunit